MYRNEVEANKNAKENSRSIWIQAILAEHWVLYCQREDFFLWDQHSKSTKLT